MLGGAVCYAYAPFGAQGGNWGPDRWSSVIAGWSVGSGSGSAHFAVCERVCGPSAPPLLSHGRL